MTRTRFMSLAGVLAAVVLASLPASSSAYCVPPYCPSPPPAPAPSPSNHFSLHKVRHPKTGMVTIRIKVPGPGAITASARGMRKTEARAKAAGVYTLKLRLTEEGMKELKKSKGRQLRLEVTFSFTPNGGQRRRKVKKLIFRVVEPGRPASAVSPDEPAGSKVVVASTATINSGKALIRVFCNGPQSCQGTLTLVASGNVTLGSASFALEAGVSRVLRLELTSRARKLLSGNRVPKARATGAGLHPHAVKLKLVK